MALDEELSWTLLGSANLIAADGISVVEEALLLVTEAVGVDVWVGLGVVGGANAVVVEAEVGAAAGVSWIMGIAVVVVVLAIVFVGVDEDVATSA